MPKSKNRRPNRQPQQTQSPLPAPSLPQANSRSLLQTLGHTWTAIVSIGAIGGFLSLVEHSWDFFVVHTQPKIEGPGLATDPFVLPFTIKNVSSFFEIREAQWTCQIPSLTFGNSSFTNLAMRAEGTTTIAPNSNALVLLSQKAAFKVFENHLWRRFPLEHRGLGWVSTKRRTLNRGSRAMSRGLSA